MKFGPAPLADCLGAVLAHSIAVEGGRLPKGRTLGEEDLALARTSGIDRLVVARLEPGDRPEDAAAAELARRVAGPGIEPEGPAHGRANLLATQAGLLLIDAAAVGAFNAVDEAITLGTLPHLARVDAGEIVGTVKIIPFAVPSAGVEAATAALGQGALRLAPFRGRSVTLIQTQLPGTSPKLLAKTERVTAGRVAALGAPGLLTVRAPHEPEALAQAIRAAGKPDMLLIAGASATSDRRDIVPTAIEAAGGRVLRLGMPVDPGNLLLLAERGGRPVIGLPGCARSPKRNGFDWVLERLFAELPVTSDDIAGMGVGGLLAETDRPEPRALSRAAVETVGVLILAAGRASRMGGSKLREDLGGRPLLAHVIGAVAAAGLPAPIVVTGHEAEATAALAAASGARAVHAPRYAEGLGHSLAAGIAAVPQDWDAVVIALGDMPLVGADIFRSLALNAREPGDIIVPEHGGKRGNPVLWGRAHFGALGGIEGDVGGKALLAERAEHVRTLDVGTDTIFLDADTPETLEAIRRRYASSKKVSAE